MDASLVEAWDEPEKLPDMREWLTEPRSEAAQAQYAFIILKKHFARAGLPVREIYTPTSWFNFGWVLYSNIGAFVREGQHSPLLKNLLVELVDFCAAIPDDSSAHRLFQILGKFIDNDLTYRRIEPLLPVKALAKMGEMHEMLDEAHQRYMRQLDESGY
ncbi:MAG: hypothetical protein DMF67_06520 [Acidobacteria bacterium]|nr:MAG: hypothetical protein DMF67_06520 [Acidobacteriota bacterium]